jgi:LAO/AO transport system kinase
MVTTNINTLVQELIDGKKRACARLITMVENESKGYLDLLREVYKYTGRAYVIGITGPPGAAECPPAEPVRRLLASWSGPALPA